ncbi:MAG: hypothetical protein ACK4HV_05145, partial [Parachlamydiaceae bacterium]
MLAKEDHFALIKEIFPQCKEANDLKLKVAYLYLDHKIERSIEIYFLLCSRPHRTRLFIQIAKKATSRQALDTFIGALITPFLIQAIFKSRSIWRNMSFTESISSMSFTAWDSISSIETN